MIESIYYLVSLKLFFVKTIEYQAKINIKKAIICLYSEGKW